MTPDRHTELTAHVRTCLKRADIKASVRKLKVCGSYVISVTVPKYGMEFTPDQQRRIREIGKNNGFTSVQGIEIDLDRMTDPYNIEFYLNPL